MKLDPSLTDDDNFFNDFSDADYDEADSRIYRKKRQISAEIRRRIEERMEEKWLAQELGDLDSY